MCNQYAKEEEKEFINMAKEYYNKIMSAKKVNWNIKQYFKILAGKNQFKKSIREIVLFHFPIIGYVTFSKIKMYKK